MDWNSIGKWLLHPSLPTNDPITKLSAIKKLQSTNVSNYNKTMSAPDERQGAIQQKRAQANPKYDKIMSAPDPRRQAIEQTRNMADTSGSFSTVPEDTGPSAYDIYQKMVATFNPDKMSKDQFAPQYAMLTKLNADAKARYASNSKTMGNMYGALQGSIKGDAAGITRDYNTAAKEIKGNYDTSQQTAQEDQVASKQQTADLLQRLGIQEAAPNVLASADKSSKMWSDLAASGNQRALNTNSAGKVSSLNYNNSMQQRAGFEGAAQKSGLLSGYTDFVNGNESKRFGVTSEEAAAKAGYRMKQMDMYQNLASVESSSANDAAKMQADAYKAAQAQSNWQKTYDQKERFDNKAVTAKASNGSYDKLEAATRGLGIWGDEDAANIVKMITESYNQDGKSFMFEGSKDLNGQAFIRQLLAKNPNFQQQPAIMKLADQFFKDQYSGK